MSNESKVINTKSSSCIFFVTVCYFPLFLLRSCDDGGNWFLYGIRFSFIDWNTSTTSKSAGVCRSNAENGSIKNEMWQLLKCCYLVSVKGRLNGRKLATKNSRR